MARNALVLGLGLGVPRALRQRRHEEFGANLHLQGFRFSVPRPAHEIPELLDAVFSPATRRSG